jgi:hypothetical protein
MMDVHGFTHKRARYHLQTKDETLKALYYFSTPPKNLIKAPLSIVADIILLNASMTITSNIGDKGSAISVHENY